MPAAEISSAASPRPRPFQPPQAPLRVLVSAVSAASRANLQRSLHEPFRLQVLAVPFSLEQLREAISEFDPDVVLLSLEEQALGSTRWSSIGSLAVPVLVVCAHASQETSAAAFRVGVKGLLTGNPTPQQFAGALEAVAAGLLVLSSDSSSDFIRALLEHHDRAAKSAGSSPALHDSPEHLTYREREILEMLTEGWSNKEIAANLGISAHTVKFHISSILGKLGAATRAEAIAIGLRQGLITI